MDVIVEQNHIIASLILSASLVGCGGGGSGGGSSTTATAASVETPEITEDGAEELIFEFQSAPLEPKVFNLGAGSGAPENHFSPGDSISLVWNTAIFFSKDGAVTASSGVKKDYIYDGLAYLSADDTIQTDQDLLLFDFDCSIPGDPAVNACTSAASYRCIYAENNNNTISCTSYPLGKTGGLLDVTVDTTAFLDVIPKTANIIVNVCLREDSEKCDEVSIPLQLN